MYFELVEAANEIDKNNEQPDKEDKRGNYSEKAVINQAKIVVEIRFQKVQFEQKDSLMLKISNIEKIV